MRGKCSSASICSPRSAGSAATFPAPRNSSGWSVRRCTASSRRWVSADRGRRDTRPMSRFIYVNGRYVPYRDAMVHVEDRGYQFADGVYEVCEVRGGQLVDERRHLQRLVRSLTELRMAL